MLVTGGAGYIGSHMVKKLVSLGYGVVIVDNLSTGFASSVKGLPLIIGDIRDTRLLSETMTANNVEIVIHFAAKTQVAESMSAPDLYYRHNVVGTQSLLDAMRLSGVTKIIASSTAAVYGEPVDGADTITEDHPKMPKNVYGQTKLAVEHMLSAYHEAFGLSYAAFRYFNVAGAHDSGEIGEAHVPETHIIPNLLKALISGKSFQLFGTDYPTGDGTCVRDYVHIDDLISAHVLALDELKSGQHLGSFNVGDNNGYSNKQLADAAERITGLQLSLDLRERRPGDPAKLVACGDKIKRELGWKPVHTLDDMIASAYKWHRGHPNGYC